MTELALQQIVLAELVAACRRETVRFQREGESDARFCLEIFRRALRTGTLDEPVNGTAPEYIDEAAREQLVVLYTEYILAQVNRKALPTQAHGELIQDVWRNFWQAANRGLTFDTLAAALAYLRQVTVSEVIKHRRSGYRRAREESLQALVERVGEERAISPASDLFEAHARSRFRERCAEVIDEPHEYRIFWLRYGLGYSPKEIALHISRPGFSTASGYTARNISDILERCFRRLSEDAEIRALLQGD